jgi:SAM-dependent methyltransferase
MGEHLPLREGVADAVLVQTVALHTDPERLGAEAHRVLRPAGRFVAVEPRPYHPIVSLFRSVASAGRGSAQTRQS